jgi:hypothetical protein
MQQLSQQLSQPLHGMHGEHIMGQQHSGSLHLCLWWKQQWWWHFFFSGITQ